MSAPLGKDCFLEGYWRIGAQTGIHKSYRLCQKWRENLPSVSIHHIAFVNINETAKRLILPILIRTYTCISVLLDVCSLRLHTYVNCIRFNHYS